MSINVFTEFENVYRTGVENQEDLVNKTNKYHVAFAARQGSPAVSYRLRLMNHRRCYNCIDEEKFLLFQLIILLLLLLLLLLLPPVAIIMWVKLSKWFYALSYWNLVLSYWNQYERKCSFVSNLSYRKPRFWCADLLGACRLVFIKSFLILVHRVYFIT